jgi:flagellar hook-associated protein 1 FlgK
MYSTFFGIELGKTALVAQQMALHTTAHNIANVNTPGYSRQQTSLVTNYPFNLPEANRLQMPAQMGTGVKVDFISRARDMLLERQIQQETSRQSVLDGKVKYLNQVESIINEPADNSIGDALDAFWASWQDLSVYPDDISTRNAVISKSQQLLHLMKTKDADLEALQNQADTNYRSDVDQINDIASQIRDINIKINQSEGVDTQPNDLLDKRDKLLRDLSKLVNFSGNEMSNGLYAITINGHTLVQDEKFIPVNVVNDPLNNNFAQAVWSDDGSTVGVSSGDMQGLVEMRDVNLPVYRGALDSIAQGLINTVNPLQNAGYALNAAAPSGLDFFTGTGLADIDVNAAILADPTQIAAATNASAPGDGSNALAIAQLKDADTMAAGTQTIGEYYQAFLNQIGLDSADAQSNQDTQTKLVQSFENLQESTSGVNLDEEMTDMMKYQQGYQAAIRVVTSMDEMIDTVVNRMGVVGR